MGKPEMLSADHLRPTLIRSTLRVWRSTHRFECVAAAWSRGFILARLLRRSTVRWFATSS